MTLLLVAIVAALGVCRATQIVLHDRILRTPREAALRRLNPHGLPPGHPDLGYLAYLLQCPWCLSTWLGAAAVAGLTWAPWATVRVLAALSLSLLAVVLDRLIDKHASDEDAAARAEPVAAWDEEPPPAVAAALAGDEPSTGTV